MLALPLPEGRLQPTPRTVAAGRWASVRGDPEGPIRSTLEGRWLGDSPSRRAGPCGSSMRPAPKALTG